MIEVSGSCPSYGRDADLIGDLSISVLASGRRLTEAESEASVFHLATVSDLNVLPAA